MQHKPCSLILAAGLGKAGHRNIGIPILGAIIQENLFFILLQIGSSSYTAFGVITSFVAACLIFKFVDCHGSVSRQCNGSQRQI